MYEVTAKRYESENSNILGFASFVVDGRFAFNGIKIIANEGSENGFFLGMPSYKVGDDRYVDYFHPISQEMANALSNAVSRALSSDVTVTIGEGETDVTIKVDLLNKDTVKGKVTLRFGNDFLCDSVNVIEGENGAFVAMPRYKNKAGEYKNYCNPITKDYRDSLAEDILETYNALVTVKENIEKRHEAKKHVDYAVKDPAAR